MRALSRWSWIPFLCLAAAAAPAGRAEEPLRGKICYSQKNENGDGYSLHVMDADGKGDAALPNMPDKLNVFPAWSPDGKRIAFMSGREETGSEFGLYLIGADGSGLRRLLENERLAGLPAWSPDGRRLLFVTERDNHPQICSVAADGGDLRELRTGVPLGLFPCYSPDGKRIAFTGGTEDDLNSLGLYLANEDGTAAEKLPGIDGFALAGPGAWSPDGKTLAYVRFDPMNRSAELHTWQLADRVDSRLVDVKVQNAGIGGMVLPSWSPDGHWILISQPGEDGKSALWRISPEGKMPERISPAGRECICPSWSR